MQQQTGPGIDGGASIAQRYGLTRSPLWSEVERAYLATNRKCTACPSTSNIQLHHIFPFHLCHLVYRGDLELDERNFLPLCEEPVNNHHLLLGHLGNFESYNNYAFPSKVGRDAILVLVAELVALIPGLTAEMIKGNTSWLQASTGRPKPWEQWTPDQRNAFRSLLDQLFPFQKTSIASAPFPYSANEPQNPAAIATTYHPDTSRGDRAATHAPASA